MCSSRHASDAVHTTWQRLLCLNVAICSRVRIGVTPKVTSPFNTPLRRTRWHDCRDIDAAHLQGGSRDRDEYGK